MANRKRPKQLVIRMTEEELAAIQDKVAKSGMNQQTYLIKCLTEAEIVNLEPIREIYPELKRQGANLNQLAKKLNERGYVDYKGELAGTLCEVKALWQSLKQYLQEHQ